MDQYRFLLLPFLFLTVSVLLSSENDLPEQMRQKSLLARFQIGMTGPVTKPDQYDLFLSVGDRNVGDRDVPPRPAPLVRRTMEKNGIKSDHFN